MIDVISYAHFLATYGDKGDDEETEHHFRKVAGRLNIAEVVSRMSSVCIDCALIALNAIG